jgi:hypothetical protein
MVVVEVAGSVIYPVRRDAVTIIFVLEVVPPF